MPSTLNAKCPCCGKTANGDLNEIEKYFGFRNMENGKKIAQSYCKNCRSKNCSPSRLCCINPKQDGLPLTPDAPMPQAPSPDGPVA